jgi:hypothetical protein
MVLGLGAGLIFLLALSPFFSSIFASCFFAKAKNTNTNKQQTKTKYPHKTQTRLPPPFFSL